MYYHRASATAHQEMKLENSFTVRSPLESTWEALLDIERVASCLPGAAIEGVDGDGTFRGRMTLKLGPMTVDYRGTAVIQDVDDDTHTAAIMVRAQESNGSGGASAVIENRAEETTGGTQVSVVTDLQVTGRVAQFGRGIMEDVAHSMMQQFAQRLERELEGGAAADGSLPPASAGPAADGEPAAAGPVGEVEGTLDLGAVLLRSELPRRIGLGLAVGLALLALLRGLHPGRRQITFNVNLRR